MVNVWDRDYPLNPNNFRYLKLAEHLDVDWKIVREVYTSLPEKDRREVGKYIDEISHEDTVRYLDKLIKFENAPSRINIPTREAA
ncbi:MAG: hypothetical protein AABW91_03595 [Nanoarchaeota archaeon]